MSRGPGGWDYSEVTPGGNDSHCLALELVGSNKTVLELGCRGGHMTRALAAQGCKVVGIDLDGEAAARAAGDAVEVIIGNVEDPTCLEELSTADFDVVLAGDLLEHLTDPLPVLRRCRSLLNLGGFLVVSVPNVAHADVRLSLLRGRFDYRPWGLLDQTHVRFFTRDTVVTLLSSAGFIPFDVRRVRTPVFNTELGVERDEIPDALLAEVLADPEAETYQFVIAAAPDNCRTRVREWSERIATLDYELLTARTERAIWEARARNADDRAKMLERELESLSRTKTFRYTSRLRGLYGRARSLARSLAVPHPSASPEDPAGQQD